MVLESALADALYLNWRVPISALPPPPAGLRYDRVGPVDASDEAATLFSLLLFRQRGIHWRGAKWLALSYPQANARLAVRDAEGEAGALLLRQLVPGWVVPIGRWLHDLPCSAAVLEFPGGGAPERWTKAPTDAPEAAHEWRWRVSAGAQIAVAAALGSGPIGAGEPPRRFEEEVAFARRRSRIYWASGGALRRVDVGPASLEPTDAAPVVPLQARLERADWLETFLPFAPVAGWRAIDSAFLVPRIELIYAFDGGRERPVAAPMAAAG